MSPSEESYATPPPVVCRPEAFHYFKRQIPRIETTSGLLHAAIAISMHALDDFDPDLVEDRLTCFAERVNERVQSSYVSARLAHLHEVFFEEEGFTGETDAYYNPLNSYLPAVLAQRRGIPITLTLIYKVVAERCGLQVEGINAPGHFLACVLDGQRRLIVDPFFGGKMLTREEAFQRVEQVIGRECPRDDRLLPMATHQQWMTRILANLQHIFAAQQRSADLAAMTELQTLLNLPPH